MPYRIDEQDNSIVLDGFEQGIASSPHVGIGNLQNVNTTYYPGVAYTNYKRQAVTTNGLGWFAGTHSTNVSNNTGWTFTAPASTTITNPVHKATSPLGLNYVLCSDGSVFKQNAVNSSTFSLLGPGLGRTGTGSGGLAYFNNYLVVFGGGLIEFCGDGTGDSGIISNNWNKSYVYTTVFTTQSGSTNTLVITSNPSVLGIIKVNDPVIFTSTVTLPSPLVAGNTYYIKTIENSGQSQFTISATIGGSAIIFTDDGTGTHTMTSTYQIAPIGNCTSFVFSSSGISSTSITIVSYIDPSGTPRGANWQEATGQYSIFDSSGNEMLATFTYGSSTVSLLNPLELTFLGGYSIKILNTSSTTYKAYVSKVDGNLYFANNRNLGRILSQDQNQAFNPNLPATYTVNYSTTALLQTSDSVIDMTDLQSTLVIAGNKDLYPWDYVSATPGASNPIGEQIVGIDNCLNNIYILAGQKGNIYISNGFSSQLFHKIPDFVAGVIDPVFSWGALMVRRSKLFFQVLVQTSTGTNVLAGIFSLIVSPSNNDGGIATLQMDAQNSYGLVPTSGAVKTGVLMDNSPSSTGYDSYYSGWSNGVATGGIDYNDTTPWNNFEATIETDIIPIGTMLDKKTMGNIEFKLDRPMVSGDAIRLYWRPSLSDTYTLLGTTNTTQLSDYYNSNISQAQWAQFKAQMKGVSSGSSLVPLREIRIHNN